MERISQDYPLTLPSNKELNADAASQKTGINSFTNSMSARQRWARSHSISMKVLFSLMDDLGFPTEDASCELKQSRITRNASDLKRVIAMFNQSMSPFSPEQDQECLFNFGSGKAASNKTKEFLLNVASIGKEIQDQFIKECSENSYRFEDKAIRRTKMDTFATEGAKRIIKSNGKLKEVKMERDLFGKILCLTLQQKKWMSEVLKYPLTPVPLAFCHYDGSFRDTPKSKLLKHLREPIVSSHPSYIDAIIIIDGNFYFHLLADRPSHSVAFSERFLKAPQIDLIFDQITIPSIKDYERDQRSKANGRSLSYQISGPAQTRPPKFKNALKNLKIP